MSEEISVVVSDLKNNADYSKCHRCNKYANDIDADETFAGVCMRCASVLHGLHYSISNGLDLHLLPRELREMSLTEFEEKYVRKKKCNGQTYI